MTKKLLVFLKKKIYLILLILLFLLIKLFSNYYIYNQKLNLSSEEWLDKKIFNNIYKSKNFYFKNKKLNFKKNNYVINLLKISCKEIENNNINLAEKYLLYLLNFKIDNNIKNIINLSLARIKIHKRDIKQALFILNRIKDFGWIELADFLKSDALFLEKKDNLAYMIYEKLLKSNISQTLRNLILLKIKNKFSFN